METRELKFELKLKELREQKKISQHKLVNDLDLKPTTYNSWENFKREPSIEMLIKLADYYNVTLDYLVGRDFTNPIGYLTENQITFVKTFLALNPNNQTDAVIFVANKLANQQANI